MAPLTVETKTKHLEMSGRHRLQKKSNITLTKPSLCKTQIMDCA